MNLILSIATRNRIFAFNVIKVRHLFSLKSRQWLDCALFCNIIYNDVSQLLATRFITPISIFCKSVVSKLQKNCCVLYKAVHGKLTLVSSFSVAASHLRTHLLWRCSEKHVFFNIKEGMKMPLLVPWLTTSMRLKTRTREKGGGKRVFKNDLRIYFDSAHLVR